MPRTLKSRWSLLAVALTLLAPPGLQAAEITRVAIVTTGPSAPPAEKLASHVIVQLTKDEKLEVLERTDVQRILSEQDLARRGINNAKDALQLGQTLEVDLFAVLQVDPAYENGVGLVCYDAHSGLRLWDGLVEGEKFEDRSASVASAVSGSAAKQRERNSTKEPLTLCFLDVRNTDLPRDMDSTCKLIGMLLERQLLACPTLAVLERSRLEHVNKERTLTTQSDDRIFGSLVCLRLDIGRTGRGDGLKVHIQLQAPDGKKLDQLEALLETRNPAQAASALAEKLAPFLNVKQVPTRPNSLAEAALFFHSAKVRSGYGDLPGALNAAEAAHALDPTDSRFQEYLASEEYLASAIVQNANAILRKWNREHHPSPNDSLLRDLLYDMERAFQLDQQIERPVAQPWKTETPAMGALCGSLSRLQQIPSSDSEIDALIVKLRTQLREAFMKRLEQCAQGVMDRKLPSRDYRRTISSLIWPYSEALAASPQQAVDDQSQLIELWMDSVTRFGPSRYQPYRFDEGSITDLPQQMISRILLHKIGAARVDDLVSLRLAQWGPLYEKMENHEHPAIRVYGRILRLWGSVEEGSMTSEELSQESRSLLTLAEQALAEPGPWSDAASTRRTYDALADFFKVLAKHSSSRNYQLSQEFRRKSQVNYREARQSENNMEDTVRTEFVVGLTNLMVGRHELAPPVIDWLFGHLSSSYRALPEHDLVPPDPAVTLRKLENETLRSLEELCDSGKCRSLGYSAARTKKKIVRYLEECDLQHIPAPISPKPRKKQAVIFRDAWQKIGVTEKFGSGVVQQVLVDGDVVYAVVTSVELGPRKYKRELALFRIDLPTGEVTEIGRTDNEHPRISHPWLVQGVCLTPDAICVATKIEGVVVFPKKGGKVRRLGNSVEMPGENVTAVTFLQGKLYLGLTTRNAGYFVAVDWKTSKYELLASSQRSEKRSPLDDGPAFEIDNLMTDKQRQRILLYLKCRNLSGLWSWHPRESKFTRLVPINSMYEGFDGSRKYDPDQVLLQGRKRVSFGKRSFRWIASVDLRSDRPQLLNAPIDFDAGFGAEKTGSVLGPMFGNPWFLQDGWFHMPGGRESLATGAQEMLRLPDSCRSRLDQIIAYRPFGKKRILMMCYSQWPTGSVETWILDLEQPIPSEATSESTDHENTRNQIQGEAE